MARPEDTLMHVLIVDDHPMYIKGIEALLFELDMQHRTSGAYNVEAALTIAAADPVNLVLLDLKLPGRTGLEALVEIKQALAGVPVVVISGDENPLRIWKAIELGAAGFIPKDTCPSLMIQALRLVLARGIYIPAEAVKQPPAADGSSTEPTVRAGTQHLGARQLAVLQGLLQCKSNKVIARNLGIAEGTVKAYLSGIYQTLGVNSRLQAMAKAHELNLVDKFPRLA